MSRENLSELAYLVCDLGSVVGILQATNHGSVTANDENEATVLDDAPGLNVPPFGTCTAVGTCNFVPFGGWTNWVQSTSGNNAGVLTVDSRLPCSNGGQIEAFTSADSLESAMADRPEVSTGVADRMAAFGILPELLAADFWLSNPDFRKHMTAGIGFAQTAMGTPIGQVYHDVDQNDVPDRARDFTESMWGTAFSLYGTRDGVRHGYHLGLRRAQTYHTAQLNGMIRQFGANPALITNPAWDRRLRFHAKGARLTTAELNRTLRPQFRTMAARGRNWYRIRQYKSLLTSAVGNPDLITNPTWRGRLDLAAKRAAVQTGAPPRPPDRFRVYKTPSRFSSAVNWSRTNPWAMRTRTAGRWGGRALGPVGMGLDGLEAYDRFRDGDTAGGTRSVVKVIAGGAMMSGNPYAMAIGGGVYLVIVVYEWDQSRRPPDYEWAPGPLDGEVMLPAQDPL